jgi:hypothetical protein
MNHGIVALTGNSSSSNGTLKLSVFLSGMVCPPHSFFKTTPPCSGPYPDYNVTIQSNDTNNTVVKSVKTNESGLVITELPEGNYVIFSPPYSLLQQPLSNYFTIERGNVTNMKIRVNGAVR